MSVGWYYVVLNNTSTSKTRCFIEDGPIGALIILHGSLFLICSWNKKDEHNVLYNASIDTLTSTKIWKQRNCKKKFKSIKQKQ